MFVLKIDINIGCFALSRTVPVVPLQQHNFFGLFRTGIKSNSVFTFTVQYSTMPLLRDMCTVWRIFWTYLNVGGGLGCENAFFELTRSISSIKTSPAFSK